jgi:hypothetical protein
MACSKPYRQCIFSEEVVRLFGLDDPGFRRPVGVNEFYLLQWVPRFFPGDDN